MTIYLDQVLPVIIYLLLIILIVVFIIVGIKLIKTLTTVNKIAEDVELKVNKLNALFEIVDNMSSGLTMISEKVSSIFYHLVDKLFSKKKGNEENE